MPHLFFLSPLKQRDMFSQNVVLIFFIRYVDFGDNVKIVDRFEPQLEQG